LAGTTAWRNGWLIMMKDLKTLIVEYQAVTKAMITEVSKDNFEILEEELSNREQVINSMKSIKFDQVELRSLCEEFQIMKLQKELDSLLIEKRSKLKDEIASLSTSKNANKTYQRGFQVDSLFFNKKI
jgi:hypothetical protein